MVGPLVARIWASMALARMLANVVLPRPGGPLSRTWSRASPRCRAAATAISSRSFTFGWPVKSANNPGRSVFSNTTSGRFKVSTGRSAIGRTMPDAARAANKVNPLGMATPTGQPGKNHLYRRIPSGIATAR